MRGPEGTVLGGESLPLTKSVQSEPQAWNPPTLMTWKIEEETLTKTGSGPDFGQY
jgi:hypothetical protein